MSALCPPGHEITLLPAPQHGARVLVWRRQPVDDAAASHRLVLGDELRPVQATEHPLSTLLESEETPGPVTLERTRPLVALAKKLVQRGSVRPTVVDEPQVRLRWKARLDGDERAVLAALCQRWPAAAWASVEGEPSTGVWAVARAVLDGLIDLLIRRAAPVPRLDGEGWEAAIERALSTDDDRPSRVVNGVRPRQYLDAWERAARDQQTPRFRLLLRLQPPAGDGDTFRLLFLLEAREGQTLFDPVEAAEVWADTPRAHLLADDLTPARTFLRQALAKAGQVLAAVEVSLASDAPGAALLSRDDAWQLLDRTRAALEATGARVELPEGFDELDARFPRARVRLARDDGRSPTEPSLANRYQVLWEVHSQGALLTADALASLGKQAPLARHEGVWLPITREAAERLARVAARPVEMWTGPQALSAALAGEVRRTGDLADAVVTFEPGLEALIEALGQEPTLVPVPAGVHATLRHYQQRGLSWLLHRARHGLGALLADDMGLGKTVQLISLLVALQEAGLDDGPTLVVCPASLVGNWERELSRFAPSLKVVRHHGAERLKGLDALAEALGSHDVLLTTYGLARRDAASFARLRWGTLVLDEAQNVKNPQSAQAKAVRTLDAARRVALSGTPVENRLSELWSLMEFLNPGLLGTHDRFRREISLPIERDRDARAVRWLRAATAPFLLRRLKRDPDIAPELPEKETIRVFCSLSEEQAKLYGEAVERSLSTLDDAGTKIERSGKVLKLLTELKQICNHPVHFLGDAGALPGRSGKLERAAEMLEEIVDGGERALVFTQYVEMASLLSAHLEKRLAREVPMFHGALTLPQREALVKRFQEEPDGPPVMVMSLRAGGVGLNLTRASHVMHYDRWWNPAVEDQASDRAHRIGQQRRVQVHLLITLGTLEERIDRLLESKRGLADAVVTGGEAWLGSLSTDELRALVSLGSDAAVESIEAWEDG